MGGLLNKCVYIEYDTVVYTHGDIAREEEDEIDEGEDGWSNMADCGSIENNAGMIWNYIFIML